MIRLHDECFFTAHVNLLYLSSSYFIYYREKSFEHTRYQRGYLSFWVGTGILVNNWISSQAKFSSFRFFIKIYFEFANCSSQRFYNHRRHTVKCQAELFHCHGVVEQGRVQLWSASASSCGERTLPQAWQLTPLTIWNRYWNRWLYAQWFVLLYKTTRKLVITQ